MKFRPSIIDWGLSSGPKKWVFAFTSRYTSFSRRYDGIAFQFLFFQLPSSLYRFSSVMAQSPSPLLIALIYISEVRSINEVQNSDPPGARFAFCDRLSQTTTSTMTSARTADSNDCQLASNGSSPRFVSMFARFLPRSSDSRHCHNL
jgi:hypothetical protein